MPARRPAPGPASARDDAAARRLALIAADLGAGPSAPRRPRGEADGAGAGSESTEEAWWADHTRVVAAAATEQGAPAPPAAAPALPTPGRHAARRRRPAVPAAVRGVGAGLPGLGPVHVAVVAVLVALGLAVTTWWVVRDRPEPVAPVSAEPAAPLLQAASSAAHPPTTSTSTSAPRSSATGATVTVDVAGKVRRPGIVVLDQGARVTDALEAAGGAKRGVDLTTLNLARVLVDGEQIVVGATAAAGAPAPGGGSAGAPASSGPLVNLNTASQVELETLPGVGPVTARSILDWRARHGGFTSVDELLEIDGIGEKTLATLGPHVTV